MDVDFLSPKIPDRLRELAFNFANEFPEYGLNPNDWINNGPESLISDLPSGWESRLQSIFEGVSLKLFTLGRDELLFSKVWAYIDRGTDLNDCIGLAPTVDELDRLVVLISGKDANPQWPAYVDTMIGNLRRALGYE